MAVETEEAFKGAVYAMLTADADVTSYCGARIQQAKLPIKVERGSQYPQVTFDTIDTGAPLTLPSENYELVVHVWVDTNADTPRTKSDRIKKAIRRLFHAQEAVINQQGFDCKCRVCQLLSGPTFPDPDGVLHTAMTFRVVLGTT